ncbi:MAG: hypothetical protein Q8K58_07280 [Acidimicrobiales bacterium]|nr:hypothetical protein [Acidimicrobiales bacterium]
MPLITHGLRAVDGWFIVQVGREPQFARLDHRPALRRAAGSDLGAGIGAGECFTDEVVADPTSPLATHWSRCPHQHVEQPVLVPGNPVPLTGVAEEPGTRMPCRRPSSGSTGEPAPPCGARASSPRGSR